MQDNKQMITNEDIQEAKERINEALPPKSLIEGTLKTKLKVNKKDFIDILFKAFPEFNAKECPEYKEIKAINNNLIDAIIENDNMKDLPELRTKLESLIVKLKWLLVVSKYLDINFVEELLMKHGLFTKFVSLSENPNLNDNIKEILKENVNESVETMKEIRMKQFNEIDPVYEALSTNVKFDKQSNPQGLKINVFNDLIKLEILKRTNPRKANAKFENMEKNIDDKAMSDLFTKTIASSIVE